MLIEFKVSNFRSIKDEQVFSLVASVDDTLRQSNVCETGVDSVPSVLRSAAIFGPNASGKSNLIKALQFMQNLVLRSAIQRPEGLNIGLQPFLLDETSVNKPSTFEITFSINKIRYQYGFTLTKKRIISEHLLVYKYPKPQQWFKRSFDPNTGEDTYKFNSGLKGKKSIWQETTRPDSLFLSNATQLNSKALKPIYNWFAEYLEILSDHKKLSPQFSAELIANRDKRNTILKFLKSADINIEDIDIKIQKMQRRTIDTDSNAGETDILEDEIEIPIIRFLHSKESGSVAFDFEEESGGTKALFALIGPGLDILEKGKILIVDELDTSLHPLLLRVFIQLFHNKKINSGDAQLIFSTHDATLLGTRQLFRRDQIYFIEKGINQATKVSSLSDFSVRKVSNIEKGYLSGRFGAIPLLEPEPELNQ